MTRTRQNTAAAGETLIEAGVHAPPPRTAPPPLAEIRRRATERLRQLACLLAVVRAEYAAAAADCQRLRAARIDVDAQSTADGEAAEPPAALEGELKRMESALAAARHRNRDLQARIAQLERGGNGCSPPVSEGGVGDHTAAVRTSANDLLRFIDELADMLPAPTRE